MIDAARILIVDDDAALLEALPERFGYGCDGIAIDTCDNAVGRARAGRRASTTTPS